MSAGKFFGNLLVKRLQLTSSRLILLTGANRQLEGCPEALPVISIKQSTSRLWCVRGLRSVAHNGNISGANRFEDNINDSGCSL